jgi:nicotinamide-nucleotide amidase
MTVELINTGSELLLGRILNGHQEWLCRRLSDLGYEVTRQVSVPDGGVAIAEAVRESLERADVVLTTGGLGPTGDDLTRERVAHLLGRTLVEDPRVGRQIRHYFESRNRPVPQRTFVESLIPVGAEVLPNHHGTAPGLAFRLEPSPFRPGSSGYLVLLPGPPRELHPMFLERAVPWLQQVAPASNPCRTLTLRTTGIGESALEEMLEGPMAELCSRGLELGYCAKIAEVEVRFAARGERAETLLAEAERAGRAILGDAVFGSGDELLESVVVRELARREATLAMAESCTGGFVAHRLTNVPGASAVFLAGFVTYANDAKVVSLGVSPDTLARNGAVSELVAREMAEGARRKARSDYAIAVTGIAGPGGGSETKPVGTAFVAVSGPDKTEAMRIFNPFDRETFKFATSQQALDFLRRSLIARTAP